MKVLFYIFGYPVHFFGVMIALGMLGGLLIAYLEVKRKKLQVEKLFDIALYSMISAVVGARLFFILFYNLSYYLKNPIDILKINEGGLSIHGGLIGAFVFGIIYFRKNKLGFFKYADAIAPGIILGQGIGRIGCDVFGKVMSVPFPWGIERQGQLLHPAQVYEFLMNYLVFFFLWRKRKNIRYNGQIFLWYIILFSINRGVVELFRNNPSVAGWFSISHLLSVLFIIGAIIVMYMARKKKQDTPTINIESKRTKIKGWLLDGLITLTLMVASIIIFYFIQG
ncbi:MAG: prolipoprotein diacylglyceryl transferase [Firmicutes bacterium HGW-Firmicutes-7]|nr:MAG: prolipoprotein diacylglyceryl transferase [Firmicutes bacterium HGW-Firmicutes-7]